MQSSLFVADNSGARKIQCIKVLGGSKRRFASIGDIIVVSIKDAIPRAKVKKGEIIERIFWARYQIGTIYSHRGDNQQALTIFKELMDSKESKGQLWKKLAAENYRSISRKLSYDDYLKN